MKKVILALTMTAMLLTNTIGLFNLQKNVIKKTNVQLIACAEVNQYECAGDPGIFPPK